MSVKKINTNSPTFQSALMNRGASSSQGKSRSIQPQDKTAINSSSESKKPWYKSPVAIATIATVGTLIVAFGAAYKKGMFTWSATPVTGRNDIYSQSRGVFGQPMSYPSDKPTLAPTHSDIYSQSRGIFGQPMSYSSDKTNTGINGTNTTRKQKISSSESGKKLSELKKHIKKINNPYRY